MSTAIDEERCHRCSGGFVTGAGSRLWMNDGHVYHRECIDEPGWYPGRDRERALVSGKIDGLREALTALRGAMNFAEAEERIEQRIRDLHATPV